MMANWIMLQDLAPSCAVTAVSDYELQKGSTVLSQHEKLVPCTWKRALRPWLSAVCNVLQDDFVVQMEINSGGCWLQTIEVLMKPWPLHLTHCIMCTWSMEHA